MTSQYEKLQKTWQMFHLEQRQIAFLGNPRNECFMGDFDEFWKVYNSNNNSNKNIYFRLNPAKAKLTTWQKDEDTKCRELILIDIDSAGHGTEPIATDEQITDALEVAKKIINLLSNEGWGYPTLCFSGNGYHLLYKYEGEEGDVQHFLQSLKENVSNYVDITVGNLGRLTRFYGTVNNKCNRESSIIEVHENQTTITAKHIENFLKKYPTKTVNQPATGNTNTYESKGWWTQEDENFRKKFLEIFGSVEDFLREQDLFKFKQQYKRNGVVHGDRLVLKRCVFQKHNSVGEEDACIFDNYLQDCKTISYKCYHNTCGVDENGNDLGGLKKFSHFVRQVLGNKEFERLFGEKTEEEKDNPNFIFNLKTRQKSPKEFFSTGYQKMNTMLGGGLEQRGLSIVSGKQGSGKSTFINNLIWNTSASDIKSIYYTEQYSDDVCDNLAKTYHQNTSISEEERDTALAELEGKLVIYNRGNNFNNWQQVLSDVSQFLDRHSDFKLLILDNLSILCPYNCENLKEQQELAIELVKLAEEKNIHVCLVVHPSKTGEKVAGTSLFENIATQVLEVENASNKQQKVTKINILKNRENGNKSSCYLTFNQNRLTEIQ